MENVKLNPNYVLDSVLKILNDSEIKLTDGDLQIKLKEIGIEKKLNIVQSIIDHLKTDGYVDEAEGKVFAISFWGEYFLGKGGYDRARREEEIQRLIDARRFRITQIMSWTGAIGAGGLLSLEIVKWLYQLLCL